MANRYVVIMAGGRGERFWPQSRVKRPKQLLPIVGDSPMIAQTLERLGENIPPERVIVLTNAEQRDALLEICPRLRPELVVGEPAGRDTAPAVALATLLVKREDPDAVFAMLPADAVIHDHAGFQSVLESAFVAAENDDVLVTIGISPEYPATGYGYIHKGEVLTEAAGRPVYTVKRFVEKPDRATAEEYLASGDYFWNAGMFVWQASVVDAAFARNTPTVHERIGRINEALDAGKPMDATLQELYPGFDKISVDYALMEKADNVVCIESAFDWDDVGEWPAIERHYDKDDAGNVLKGAGRIQDGSGNIVFGDKDHYTAVLGCDDLIIVHTGDATLVCRKDKAQDLKALVKAIGEERPDLM
ncbi:MAG: mannose-1-phosphate guanylyltransferase [Opitutales bacterium]